MNPKIITRRAFVAAVALGASGLSARAQSLPAIQVWKDAGCGCCNGWIDHLRKAGFAVTAENVADMNAVKTRLGVPDDLASCHTAVVGGYVIEGHVPPGSIKKLLETKPKATGLAVPGMPASAPGMDGPADDYEVIQFGEGGRSRFARYRGHDEI